MSTGGEGDLVELAAHLRLAIGRLHRQLRLNDGGELTPTQVAALVSVERRGPLTLGELAAMEHLAPPSITSVIGKLEARGLVARRQQPDDRRVWHVEITPAGSEFLTETRARRTAWLVAALERLSPADLRRLAAAADVLDRVGQIPAEAHR